MSRARAIFWSVVGIVGFIVLVLCGIGAASYGILFALGAPHAIPVSPGLAAIFFLITLLCWAAAIELLRRSVRTLSSTSQGARQQQVRRWLYASAGAVVLLMFAAILFPSLFQPWWPARGSVPHGDYKVEPTLWSSCATNAHRVFYKGRLVTKVAAETIFSPHNPSRLLYTVACANNGDEAGVFYTDGVRPPVQANPLTLYESGDWMNSYWSPDDRFVIVPVRGKDTLVNLETGKRSKDLSDLFSNPSAFSSGAEFRGWSPDGKKFAIVVSITEMRDDRSLHRELELASVDPATLEKSYVATMRKDDGWHTGEFTWVSKGGTYDLAVDPSLQSNESVYRKPR